jgi:predicted metal-dependent HD superfamily phosphohydrolase
MKLTTELLHETALFIKEYYQKEFSSDFSFHNYARGVNIVRNCNTIGAQMNLDKEELEVLHLASWFLETGYAKDYYNYQKASVTIADKYCRETGVDDDIIRVIEETILSTRYPQQPVTIMARVLCDAALYHLAEKNLPQNIENLSRERREVLKEAYSDKDGLVEIINTMNDHFYFTSAARELFEKKKQKQKKLLQKKLDDLRGSPAEHTNNEQQLQTNEKNVDPVSEDMKLERGVETFFRITERRNMELSNLAHDKAGLLISINSIVISIVLSVLITKLEENKFLLFPTLLLVITCTSTIILAVISTKPRFIKANAKKNNTEPNEANIMFFGDFSKLSLTDYKKAMKETYKNKTELYDSLSRDIYYHGITLVWKFRYINFAYNIFMYGFIITILAFITAFIIHTI